MQFKFFVIPIKSQDGAEEEMNRFLRGHRVLAVEKRFTEGGENPCWSFCIEYLEGAKATRSTLKASPKVDYKEVLSIEDFALFFRLRDLRKTLAEKEGLPVYTIFTKERVIHTADFSGRVMHHAVMNVCKPDLERAAIEDSYACRKGKGSLATIASGRVFCDRCLPSKVPDLVFMLKVIAKQLVIPNARVGQP